jgi:small subunit ribosomal protein S6
VIDRATRSVAASGGQVVKVSPWGRRRLAYPIGQQREGSYFIVQFDAPAPAVLELERSLNITEEVMRHLITHVERPQARRASADVGDGMADEEFVVPPVDEEDEIPAEFIDESESEAAPAAADR